MPSDFEIRPENPGDEAGITEVIRRAFEGKAYAEGDEAELVVRLRQIGDLPLSLVAVSKERLIGQATFSPATHESGQLGWYALGPLAVLPEFQGRGIGSALIGEGMALLVELRARGCILVGDPKYYNRFGFLTSPDHCQENQPRDYFMVKSLGSAIPERKFRFHPAFDAGALGPERS